MKTIKILSILLIFSTAFTACTKNEYYAPTTTQPTGYSYTFNDEFDADAHNWSFYDPSANAKAVIRNSTLEYTYYPSDQGSNTVAIDLGADLSNNFLIQTRLKTNNSMGLVFGVSNSNYGYSFIINDNGTFGVFKEGSANTSVQTLVDWQSSNAIVNGWNDVEIEQLNGRWIGYINNTQVFEIKANYLSGDKIGYIVLDGTTGNADYLTVKW